MLGQTEKFLKEANWSFDPTKFGFYVFRRFNTAFLDPNPPTKFYWLAEKTIRYKKNNPYYGRLNLQYDMCDCFSIRKNLKTGQYQIIRERISQVPDDYDNNPEMVKKTFMIKVDNQLQAEGVLKEIGALRKKS